MLLQQSSVVLFIDVKHYIQGGEVGLRRQKADVEQEPSSIAAPTKACRMLF